MPEPLVNGLGMVFGLALVLAFGVALPYILLAHAQEWNNPGQARGLGILWVLLEVDLLLGMFATGAWVEPTQWVLFGVGFLAFLVGISSD